MDRKDLGGEELKQVSGGAGYYRMSDYEDVIGENDSEYTCKVCGLKFTKEYCIYADVIQHLRKEHGIDRCVR